MKKYVVFRNASTFSDENLLKYLRVHIRINVRINFSVGTYGQLWGGMKNIQTMKIQSNFSVQIFTTIRLYDNRPPYVRVCCKK